MERHTFALKIKKGQLANYRQTLGEVWTDVKKLLDKYQATNFSIWAADLFVFGYCETDTPVALTEELQAEIAALDSRFAGTYDWISEPGKPMRLMYHQYGQVQQNKALVHHRVFMTHLIDGNTTEYKARHDAILLPPEEECKPLSMNNFTIWNAGDYIFGYAEIDSTKDSEETEEAHAATVKWETSMLEIMEWITNDVDWLTGIYHGNCKRIAHYK